MPGTFLFSFPIQCMGVTVSCTRNALPVQLMGLCRRERGMMLPLPQLWMSWGRDRRVELTVSPVICRSTPVNARLQCQLSRRTQEDLSVFLSHSVVGGWCLFILPGKDLMNLCPSVQIRSFLAATSSSFQAFVSFFKAFPELVNLYPQCVLLPL